ncbi:PrgI family protein [Patescibacteria group bacterium]|nr:PrgI family protein [Patescibacteria group bacterium]MDE1946649.1 PrgI family protein [Patescibacteria group bacterium]MDE2010602.1 PrgI family protein [Patescibacteria group bacterium]MDE2232951.1 PrgI family protein [Patescibacteria group bacterium]
MRFQVPQFIEVEDKIFGPLTLKQFIYLAGGGGLSFITYVIIGNLALALIPMLVIMAVSAALAFYKVYNHFPLLSVAESAFKYWRGGKLYIWKKEDKKPPASGQAAAKEIRNYASVMVPKISDSKLKDLAWSLDIKESVYSNKNQK